jgi:predicted nucleotidyltransferase
MNLPATGPLEACSARLIDLLGRNEAVQVACLFGSGARQGLRFQSDLDVAVASSGGPLAPAALREIARQIAEATGRAADVVDLAVASAPVLRAALVEGRQLLCADPALLFALRRRLVYEAEDFLPYQRRLLEERRRRWTGT